MLGTLIGSIAGSTHDVRTHLGRPLRAWLPAHARLTGDAVRTVGTADALLAGAAHASVLQAWCRRHQATARWDPAFARWVAADRPQPCDEPDHRVAVRVSPAGLLGRSIEDTLGRTLRATALTHDHPEALRAALAVAATIRWAREGMSADALRESVTAHFAFDLTGRGHPRRSGVAHGARAASFAPQVPPAIDCALSATGFEDALHRAAHHASSTGGDVESIAAIAGGTAEARFGIPPDIAAMGWALLPADMRAVLVRMYEAAGCAVPRLLRSGDDEADRAAA